MGIGRNILQYSCYPVIELVIDFYNLTQGILTRETLLRQGFSQNYG